MTKRYQLSTIKDIYEKVPVDKVDTCLRELSLSIRHAKLTESALLSKVSNFSHQPSKKKPFSWPNVIHWIDDGRGDIHSHFESEESGNPILTLSDTLGDDLSLDFNSSNEINEGSSHNGDSACPSPRNDNFPQIGQQVLVLHPEQREWIEYEVRDYRVIPIQLDKSCAISVYLVLQNIGNGQIVTRPLLEVKREDGTYFMDSLGNQTNSGKFGA